MIRSVWPRAKVSICWWHERKAVRERIGKSKLSTTPYNADRAHAQFTFINKTFIPPGRADPNEREGEREGGGRDNSVDEPEEQSEPDPNAVFIHLPATQPPISTPAANTRYNTHPFIPFAASNARCKESHVGLTPSPRSWENIRL